MEDTAKLGLFAPLGDADPVHKSFLAAFPEQAKTLTLLYDVSRELTSILNREELLRRIAERVKRLVNYDLFSVMLWNEETQLLESAFTQRYEDSLPLRWRVSLHQGITGSAAGQRRTLRINDILNDPRYLHCEPGMETRSELVIPLLLQDRLIGVLDLESIKPNAFTEEHERMLTTLGSYIAVALENSRLYEAARENQLRLQEELNTAREIQRQLLPHGARDIPGLDLAASYCSARELGGDFYDFLPYGEGQLALALGDVSGKGTAAALYGSLAIGTLRELVVNSASAPANMLALLNQRMNGARLDARFIALLFAVYDASARRLTLANAGGPYPLLLRDGLAQEIRVSGVPLGLFPGTAYDETAVKLQPGDVVLFASDGILESQNAAEEEFGSERLHAVLAEITPDYEAGQISEKVLAATDAHVGVGVPPHDDRTLMVLRVTDGGAADYSKLPIIY
jgi:sigma-B regulation protein RsbU (phosphoserine phosphatase)